MTIFRLRQRRLLSLQALPAKSFVQKQESECGEVTESQKNGKYIDSIMSRQVKKKESDDVKYTTKKWKRKKRSKFVVEEEIGTQESERNQERIKNVTRSYM